MKGFKIDDKIFECIDGHCQLSLGSHATLAYSFDLDKHPDYQKYFMNRFHNNERFDIVSTKYFAKSTIIKLLDLDNNRLNLTMRCDVLQTLTPDERREDILNDLLNSTFDNELNIKQT